MISENTKIKVIFGTYGTGTVLNRARDGFHGGVVHAVWFVRLDDGREIQIEEDMLEEVK